MRYNSYCPLNDDATHFPLGVETCKGSFLKKICNCGQITLWTTHLMAIMIALNSSFCEDQSRPKDHSNQIRESVFMKNSPRAYLIRLTLKQYLNDSSLYDNYL